jgi:hypothetical protein
MDGLGWSPSGRFTESILFAILKEAGSLVSRNVLIKKDLDEVIAKTEGCVLNTPLPDDHVCESQNDLTPMNSRCFDSVINYARKVVSQI